MFYNQECFVVERRTKANSINLKRTHYKNPSVLKMDDGDMYFALNKSHYCYVDPLEIAFLRKEDSTSFSD